MIDDGEIELYFNEDDVEQNIDEDEIDQNNIFLSHNVSHLSTSLLEHIYDEDENPIDEENEEL